MAGIPGTGVFKLENTENGVLLIGDLWDIKSSKRLGFNLFGKNITTGENLDTVLEVGNADSPGSYNFKHKKDSESGANAVSLGAQITCELLGGFIKVTGGFDFEVGWSNGMSTEEFVQFCEFPLNTINLKNDEIPSSFYDEHVDDLLNKDIICSDTTYIVKSMEIGGRMTGSIKITQKKTGDKFKVGFFIEGTADLMLLSGTVSAHAEVGEEIKVENYESTIKLTSMPPISPPTRIEDFIGDNCPVDKSSIGFRFAEELKKTELGFWSELNGDKKLIGIPIKFTLVPLSTIWTRRTPEEGNNRTSPIQSIIDDTKFKEFSTVLCILTDMSGVDYLKRKILSQRLRSQKLLTESTHKQTIKVLDEETELKELAGTEMYKILKAYLEFKRKPVTEESKDAFFKIVTDLKDRIDGDITTKVIKTVETFIEATVDELRAVQVTEKEGEKDEEADNKQEDKSPLIYFTNESELNAWIRARRFCKLLFKAPPLTESPESQSTQETDPEDPRPIQQRIYKMSQGLGQLYIQPGIAYPTLTKKISKRRQEPCPQGSFSITTPNGSICLSTSKDNEEDQRRLGFILDILDSMTGTGADLQYSTIGRLYNAYCEIHGLKLNIGNTVDVIPVLDLLYNVFGTLAITHKESDTKLAIEGQNNLAFLFCLDGVQSARHVVHAVLQLQQAIDEEPDILCGTFGISDAPDAPPLFIIWNSKVFDICLDYLGLLVLLDMYRDSRWDIDAIVNHVNDGVTDKAICSKSRVWFAKAVLGIENENKDNITSDILLDIVTAVLSSDADGIFGIANRFTILAVDILDKTYSPGDIHQNWSPEMGYGWELSSPEWSGLLTSLETFFYKKDSNPTETKEGFGYYNAVKNLWSVFGPLAEDIPEYVEEPKPEVPPGGYEDPPTFPTPVEQEKLITDGLLGFEGEQSPEFVRQLSEINSILSHLSSKACAKLYYATLAKETGRITITDENIKFKIQAIDHLKSIIKDIVDHARVTDGVMYNLIHFAIAIAFPPEKPKEDPDEPEYDPSKISLEIVSRIKSNFKYGRYFHIASDLVENTPSLFEFHELAKFNLEMGRLTSIKDWLNLIRLIEVMAEFDNGKALELIWSNRNFLYMIYANLKEEFVIRALTKAFVYEGGSIPVYIPTDIATLLLEKYFTIDENPIGFQELWKDYKTLLKSFQVLWVVQKIPEDFQTCLLRNIVSRNRKHNPTKEHLKNVGALFYWNENESYFEEVWDLKTIHQAIKKLMGTEEKQLRNSFKTLRNRQKPNISYNNANKRWTTTEISTLDYLQVRKSPQEQKSMNIQDLLYHLKLSKFDQIEMRDNPFLSPERVDTLSSLLSKVVPRLANEILTIFSSKFRNKYALPLIVSDNLNYFGFSPNHLQQFLENSIQLPKIVTAIRIGENDHSKSQFLNNFLTKNKEAFASKANSGEIPQFLKGFTELMEMPELNANPDFYELMKKEESSFILINLHGDALELQEHLKYLQKISSCFLLFWNPQGWDSIVGKKAQLLELIKPSHSIVSVYVDPLSDILEKIDPKSVLKTLEDTDENMGNLIQAVNSTLTHRPRQPGNLSGDDLHQITFPKSHPAAVDLADWIKNIGVNGVKTSLILQKGTGSKTREELDSHWSSNAIYSQLILKLVEILKTNDHNAILSDLSELLAPSYSTMHGKSWVHLNQMSHQDFGHISFGSDPTLKRQTLLRTFQNNFDNNSLQIQELILEICKIWDLDSAKLPGINPSSIITLLFQESHSIPIPSIANQSFFVEQWSQDFINHLPQSKVLVVSCLGGNSFDIQAVLESTFGVHFTSSSMAWSDTVWTGISMRYLQFSLDVQEETGVEGILTLQGRPLGQNVTIGSKTYDELDRQISTFLIALSNITFCFDSKNFKDILQTSLLGLNKIPIAEEDNIPQLYFIGVGTPQDKAELSEMMENVLKSDWNDYEGVSTLGMKVVSRVIADLNGEDIIFDISSGKEGRCLIPLSDSLIRAANKEGINCPFLPDFLDTVGPIWEHVKDNIKFPYPDLDEIERSKKFNEELVKLLNLIDECFTYHVEDYYTDIFGEMAVIINAWAESIENGEADTEVSPEAKRDQALTNISNYANLIFEECVIEQTKSNPPSEGNCEWCLEKMAVQNEILEKWEWDDEATGTEFTKLKLLKMTETYVEWENKHYNNLAKQLVTAAESTLLSQEENTYKEESPEFSPRQVQSLESRIVRSERRLLQEVEFVFPKVDMHWEENRDDYDYLTEIPAYIDGTGKPIKLTAKEASELSEMLKPVPNCIVKEGGYFGIYQNGMVRRTQMKVDGIFAQGTWKDLVILSSFKLRVKSHTIWKLNKTLEESEKQWVTRYDPLHLHYPDE